MTKKSETTLDNEPRLIRRAEVSPLLWGDEEAGFANDLFYQLTPQLAIVVACIPPGGAFTSSEHNRTVFDSDEALYILDGQYTIQNPESGEVRVADEGQLILLRGPQWHYGYNFSDRELRIFEAIAPIDMTNSTVDMIKPVVAKGFDHDALTDFPRHRNRGASNMDVVKEGETLPMLLGDKNVMRLDVFSSNERVSLGRFELAPGKRSDTFSSCDESAIFVTSGRLHVRVAAKDLWIEVNEDELFALPAKTEWQVFNHGGERVTALLAVSGNLNSGLSLAK